MEKAPSHCKSIHFFQSPTSNTHFFLSFFPIFCTNFHHVFPTQVETGQFEYLLSKEFYLKIHK